MDQADIKDQWLPDSPKKLLLTVATWRALAGKPLFNETIRYWRGAVGCSWLFHRHRISLYCLILILGTAYDYSQGIHRQPVPEGTSTADWLHGLRASEPCLNGIKVKVPDQSIQVLTMLSLILPAACLN